MNPVGYLDTGVLYCDDNLSRLSEFPSECVDLIYLDPPFFSNRFYEVIWGDEAEVRSFEDRWEGGVHHYIGWMQDRILELHRILKPTGSLYLHCDRHAGHRLKLLLDDVFGENRFQNEVIWYFRGGGVSKRRWGRRHQTIFFYSKGTEWTFNVDPVRTEYSESVMESLPSRYDKSYRGDRVYSGYRPNPLGKHPDDVWPIQPIMPSDKTERLGYPTQKPEALLEQIIQASSNPGDIVLDPFCGCGTTVAVAEKLQRKWIGIDISPSAIGVMKRRLEKIGATPEIVGLPMTEADLRTLKPFEFQNWVIQQVNGTPSPRRSGDMGIDGLSFMYHEPIQVKRSDHVGRNVVDNFSWAVKRSGNDVGYIVAFSFTKDAHEEVARASRGGEVNIVLVTVADLLNASEAMTRPGAPMPPRRRAVRATPDLMRLLSALERSVEDRPLPASRPKDARPPVEELIESDIAAD
jgi:DNA modification methylase